MKFITVATRLLKIPRIITQSHLIIRKYSLHLAISITINISLEHNQVTWYTPSQLEHYDNLSSLSYINLLMHARLGACDKLCMENVQCYTGPTLLASFITL